MVPITTRRDVHVAFKHYRMLHKKYTDSLELSTEYCTTNNVIPDPGYRTADIYSIEGVINTIAHRLSEHCMSAKILQPRKWPYHTLEMRINGHDWLYAKDMRALEHNNGYTVPLPRTLINYRSQPTPPTRMARANKQLGITYTPRPYTITAVRNEVILNWKVSPLWLVYQ